MAKFGLEQVAGFNRNEWPGLGWNEWQYSLDYANSGDTDHELGGRNGRPRHERILRIADQSGGVLDRMSSLPSKVLAQRTLPEIRSRINDRSETRMTSPIGSESSVHERSSLLTDAPHARPRDATPKWPFNTDAIEHHLL